MAIVLICGSRDFTDRERIRLRMAQLPPGTVIVHGAARGADTIAGEIAAEMGLEVRAHPAEWRKYGRAAGPIRNQAMLDIEHPDLVIAYPEDEARGTWDMVRRARKAGVPTEVL